MERKLFLFFSDLTNRQGYIGDGIVSLSNSDELYNSWYYECTSDLLTKGNNSDIINNITSMESSPFILYPNPISSSAKLEIGNLTEVANVEIYNLKAVLCQKSTVRDGELELMNLHPGLYMIIIHTDGQIVKGKLLVE